MGQVICMDCGVLIRVDPNINGTSHGLCPACAAKRIREAQRIPQAPSTPFGSHNPKGGK